MRKLIITAAMLLVSAAASAQTPADADPAEALRRGTAEGAAYCKANLASAPGDLKVGEIEAFCSCMGVNEYAMKSMDDATKAMLRPRQQQTCIASLRKDSAPAQTVMPASPPVPAMAQPPQAAPAAPAPVPAPPATEVATSPVATSPVSNPFYGVWGATRAACVEASKDQAPEATEKDYFLFIGEKIQLESYEFCRILKTTGSGQERTYRLKCDSEGSEETETYDVKFALSGSDALINRRSGQKLMLCTRNTPAWVKEVGKRLFNVVEGQGAGAPTPVAPTGRAAPAAAMAAAPPKEPAKPACGGSFEAQYAKTRQRERQIAGEMGQHMQWTPRAFWNFCALERERLALAQRTLSQVKACPSAPSAKAAQRASLDTIQRVNRSINRPGCA